MAFSVLISMYFIQRLCRMFIAKSCWWQTDV